MILSSHPFPPSGSPVDIMAILPRLPELTASLEHHGLKVQEQISDVGQLVEEQETERILRGSQTMDWTDYHDYDTVRHAGYAPSLPLS